LARRSRKIGNRDFSGRRRSGFSGYGRNRPIAGAGKTVEMDVAERKHELTCQREQRQ
jgi:hypothetical protein